MSRADAELRALAEGTTSRGHDGVRTWWEQFGVRSRMCVGRCSKFAAPAMGPSRSFFRTEREAVQALALRE
jgi:hypothetical protein